MDTNRSFWEEYDKKNPPKAGKYIVKTRTQMGNINRFESTFSGKSWGCSNQIVTHYLHEEY